MEEEKNLYDLSKEELDGEVLCPKCHHFRHNGKTA